MGTSTRKVAMQLWGGGLPDRRPGAAGARAVRRGERRPGRAFRLAGHDRPDLSRRQPPGLRLTTTRAAYFPAHVESNTDPEVARWLEKVIHMVPGRATPDGYNPLGVKHLDPEWIRRLGQSGKDCF